jgi:hypothetical protein
LNIILVSANGLRAWDRTNLSTAVLLWDYTAGGDIRGVASKSTTTWFLGGRFSVAEFIKFHFEAANTAQLTYTAVTTNNFGLTWYINTAYIM